MALSSCKDEQEQNVASNFENQEADYVNWKVLFSKHHTISNQEAEKTAVTFLKNFQKGKGLKNAQSFQIANSVVRRGGNGLKSSNGQCQDTLGYVFNLSDNNGYLYVCADDRADVGVVAMMDEGCYNADTESNSENVNSLMQKLDNYVSSRISEFEAKKEKRLLLVEDAIEKGTLDTVKSGLKVSGLYIPNYMKFIEPLMRAKLGQGSAESASLPYCTCSYCTRNGKQTRVKPGCLTIAVAQCLAYYGYPDFRKGNTGKYYEYYALNYIEPAYAAPNKAAKLKEQGEFIRYIYDKIKENGGLIRSDHYSTEMKSESIDTWLKRYYFVSNSMPFNEETMCNYLDNILTPLLIQGKGVNTQGHIWVADGYLWLKGKRYNTSKNREEPYTTYYFHYNWGWDGSCNGYFASGVFKPGSIPEGFHYDDESVSASCNYEYTDVTYRYMYPQDGRSPKYPAN